MTWLLVAVGAAVGASLRHLLDQAVRRRCSSAFPWGTLVANVTGSLFLGLLLGFARAGVAGAESLALLATGLCGALSTFSTFSYQTLRLAEDGRVPLAVGNVLASVLAAVGAVALGLELARHLPG